MPILDAARPAPHSSLSSTRKMYRPGPRRPHDYRPAPSAYISRLSISLAANSMMRTTRKDLRTPATSPAPRSCCTRAPAARR
ncbi:hypothetical protein BC567DRAFT_239649 [Phyllosticta citribraziliensis]